MKKLLILGASPLAGNETEWFTIQRDSHTPESKPKLRQYSSSGKVPVLLHGSQTVWESLAIVEYLAESRRSPTPTRKGGVGMNPG